ncbi:hypothetical protein F4779DRAFT_446244 [Xylariaceae sp. FL0662B]|nr:hypothetical protein F4779DRAFT_446244 [Xylariaceae sp. FL0662B]
MRNPLITALPGLLPLLLPLLPGPTLALSPPHSDQTTVTLVIPSSQQLPNPHTQLPASTHATLTALSARHDAPLTIADAFVFRNVTPGSYLADVHCPTHGFAPLRVDVDIDADGQGLRTRAWETFRGHDWANRGEEARRTSVGGDAAFAVRVLGAKVHFTERGAFSIFGILKNPMILMGLVSMVLFLGLPKLIENMDPEMRAEWEEQQKKNPMGSLMGGGPQPGSSPMGNFDMAAYLAGQNNKKEEGETSSGGGGGSSSSHSGHGGKKGGKR